MKTNEIALKIRRLRKSLKLTQSQFAELVHLSVDGIGKIERGVGVPTVDTLIKIALAAKIPVEDLIQPAKKKLPAKYRELDELIAYVQTLPPDDIRLIHEIAIKIFAKKHK